MNASELSYLLPYILSLALSCAIFAYVWAHRHIPGGTAYACFVGGQILAILGFILELTGPGLNSKLFWDKFEWLAQAITHISFPLFVLAFTEFKLPYRRLVLTCLVAIPLLFSLLVILDPWLGLLYQESRLTQDLPFPDLDYRFTLTVYVYAIYVYAVAFGSLGILVWSVFHSQRLFAIQTLIVLVGLLVPALLSLFAFFDIRLTQHRDVTPITFALGNLIVVWGLYRYQLFNVPPVGRDTVIENLGDPVIVVDLRNRVVDINPATARLIHANSAQVIGRPARQVFESWQFLFDELATVTEYRTEIAGQVNGAVRQYELRVSPIRNRRGQIIGRAFTASDITERVALQTELQQMNQALETRVRERTQDLQEAYDTTLRGWAKTLELRDEETEGHTRRVTELALKLARAVGVSEQELVHIRRGAILHDIGKIALPDKILLKPARLTPEEFEIVKRHPVIAYELLSPIPFLKPAMDIPYCHHEKWDGSGYPRGLRGTKIPLAARIFTLADVWDALQSNRPYNKPWSRAQTLEYIRAQSGAHFDPQLVNIFLELVS